jgi:hypothetical protein
MIETYIKKIASSTAQGDAREESYYGNFSNFLGSFAEETGKKHIQITTLPKKTEAGNPDFCVLDHYVKDRKGRQLDDPGHYCLMGTSIAKTIEVQKETDKLFPKVEKKVIG